MRTKEEIGALVVKWARFLDEIEDPKKRRAMAVLLENNAARQIGDVTQDEEGRFVLPIASRDRTYGGTLSCERTGPFECHRWPQVQAPVEGSRCACGQIEWMGRWVGRSDGVEPSSGS